MTATPSPSPRPRIVDVAFWVLLAGAVMLILGGLLATTVTFDAARRAITSSVDDDRVRTYLVVYRGMGVGAILAGGALAFLGGRARRGDPRYRRALLALALATVAVLGVIAVLAGVAQAVVLLALVPILVSVVLWTRPAAGAWYHERAR
ncbi:MAG: hypothetical protein JST91_23775 [Actinobacteria bacterium]|nr:hypothetical protein [Actinomycetota bacterium]